MATILPSPPRVGMVSLGCPKNLVDSERILGQLRSDGYQMSADYSGADVVLVNTCGFLDSAKEESLEAIGEAADWIEERLAPLMDRVERREIPGYGPVLMGFRRGRSERSSSSSSGRTVGARNCVVLTRPA